MMMSIDKLESLAQDILTQCERTRDNGLDRINHDTLLKVFSYLTTSFEAITSAITPEARHQISQSFPPRWKNAFIDLAAIGPSATILSTTAPSATTPAATTPAATTSAAIAPLSITPLSTTPSATTPAAIAPLSTTPLSTAPSATTPAATTPAATTPAATTLTTTALPDPNPSIDEKGSKITVESFVLKNLVAWAESPSKFFGQDSHSPERLCSYILALQKSNNLYQFRLRFAQLRLYRLKRNWKGFSVEELKNLLNKEGIEITESQFDEWTRAGGTWDLFERSFGYGTLLGSDLTQTQALKFPKRNPETRLAEQERRGIKKTAETCSATATTLWEHLEKNSLLDVFISENPTSRKRGASQALTNQDRRPFHIDETPVEFAPQTELNSSSAITEGSDAAKRGTVGVDRYTTRGLRGYEESRPDVENLQQPSPTPTLQATPLPSHSIGHELSHNPRETPYHPQAPGGISSSSPATHSAPSSTAVQILPTQTPSFDSRSNSRGHIPTQSPSSVQSRHPEPSHGSAETHHQQHNYPPPQPPTPDKVSDATTTQSHAIGTPSSRPQSESHQFTVQEHLDSTRSFGPSSSEHGLRESATPCEALGSQHSLPGRQTGTLHATSPVQSQLQQPQHPEDTGCLDQLMDQASFMSYQHFELNQDTSVTDIEWNSIAWDFEDVSTSNLLFQDSGEALSL